MAVIDVRDRLALALDVDSAEEARALAGSLQEWFGVVKVGLELFTRCGPPIVTALHDDGFQIFLDLKLHDIPTTVHKAATALAALRVRYTTMHAAGGEAMLRAGVDGLERGTLEGEPCPIALAVTVLTSDPNASAFDTRLETARAAGVPGIVCSAHELGRVAVSGGDVFTMVPGVRLAGANLDDQERVATPAEAILNGAGCLVIGRTVTAAADMKLAAAEVTNEVVRAIATE